MLAEMIDKIVSLKETKTFQIDGHTWADRELTLVEYEKPRPVSIDLHSLDAVCRMVREELALILGTVFVSVEQSVCGGLFGNGELPADGRFSIFGTR